jgi:BirA family biotin operon repressor/biotin-[acetyl-CoA-carboxylase] ligase
MNKDEAILRVLLAAGGQAVAPLDLAARASLTRRDLDVHLDALRKCGFDIERHPALGVRLVELPERLVPDDIGARLPPERTVGHPILVFAETSSTNDVATRLARQAMEEGAVVFAESQTAGRGRHGRAWVSPTAKGLWFTLLLRPKLPPSSASRLTVMAGVAVATALRRATGLPLRIKWPNDVLCRGKKLAGILTELEIEEERLVHALVGVGVDVNLDTGDFPEELQNMATSLKLEAGRSFSRAALAAELLGEFEKGITRLGDDQFAGIADEWVALDDTLGRQVTIEGPGGRRRGHASGIDPDGALLLRLDGGRIERVLGGEVTLERTAN